jgi:hypothetical protein
MTKERTIEALDACAKVIYELDRGLVPERCRTELRGGGLPFRERHQHILYMVETAKNFVEIGKTEKAMRWLGFIQGAMWGNGYIAIDDLKQMNMPKGEEVHDNA